MCPESKAFFWVGNKNGRTAFRSVELVSNTSTTLLRVAVAPDSLLPRIPVQHIFHGTR